MLHHIGISVTEPAEIRKFYEEILLFSLSYRYPLVSEELLQSIFATDQQTEVYMIEREHLKLELFIDPEKEKKHFSHLCLEYSNPDEISDHAHQQGYRRWIKNGPNRITHFIWDKSGNMFEIKQKEEEP